MKFFVNFLSAFRIVAAFAIVPSIMLHWYWIAFALFALGALSDLFDGMLARRYNECTKLGGVMDHIGDKLLVANTLIMLASMMSLWFIVVPVIILIARELYISGLREFIGTQKMEMPVPKARFSMGKIKTALQMLTIASFLFLFALATVINIETISRPSLLAMNILSQAGIVGLWLSVAASLISAAQYTVTFLKKIK